MSRLAYVNGVFRPQRGPSIDVEDRGFQFADGVYEVWAVRDARLLDEVGHYERLERSLRELRIAAPLSRAALGVAVRETLRRNRVRTGIVYLQITRGVARRDHAFPRQEVPATVVITARALDWDAIEATAATGIAVVSTPETRWARCDIKSTALLANVLAKQFARENGAREAWFVDHDGFVTEGASSNAWIVDAAGVVRTRSLTANILRGITRGGVLATIERLGLAVSQSPFTLAEAYAAREAFNTAASAFVQPVVAIDGRVIGSGAPGPVARALRTVYLASRI
jgi:D-alanine transaminase